MKPQPSVEYVFKFLSIYFTSIFSSYSLFLMLSYMNKAKFKLNHSNERVYDETLYISLFSQDITKSGYSLLFIFIHLVEL